MPTRRVAIAIRDEIKLRARQRFGTPLAPLACVFLRRCAWHRRYHGYGKFLGVSHWRGWGLTFTDGMCDGCAARARAEWRIPTPDSALMLPRPRRRSLRPDFALTAAVVLLAVTVTFGLIVGPPASGPVTTLDAMTAARDAEERGNGAPPSTASDAHSSAATPHAVPPARAPAAGAVSQVERTPRSAGSGASLSSGAMRTRIARARATGGGAAGAGRARVARAAYRPVLVPVSLDMLAVEAPPAAPVPLEEVSEPPIQAP